MGKDTRADLRIHKAAFGLTETKHPATDDVHQQPESHRQLVSLSQGVKWDEPSACTFKSYKEKAAYVPVSLQIRVRVQTSVI